jgi:hypothetical protein
MTAKQKRLMAAMLGVWLVHAAWILPCAPVWNPVVVFFMTFAAASLATVFTCGLIFVTYAIAKES